MALAPAYHMALELPPDRQPLPVFKVLYRNTQRIQERGGRREEALRSVAAASADGATSVALREAVHRQDAAAAEQTLAGLSQRTPDEAFNGLLEVVQESTEVHRVVLPYRAWDLLGIIGQEQALTLLRQSVRYCVRAESWSRSGPRDEPRTLLPRILDEHRLLSRAPGDRAMDDAWVEQLSQMIFAATPTQAANAAASALAEGISPADVGEAVTLAANQLILRDPGRAPRDESAESRPAASMAIPLACMPAIPPMHGGISPGRPMRETASQA